MFSALAVAVGGALGALARFGAGRLVSDVLPQPYPWGTWTVNLVGCLLIGVTIPLFGSFSGNEEARFLLVVGFLGSFTTFSTYSLDTVALWGNGHGWLAVANAVGSVVCGLLFVAVGRELSAWMLGL